MVGTLFSVYMLDISVKWLSSALKMDATVGCAIVIVTVCTVP